MGTLTTMLTTLPSHFWPCAHLFPAGIGACEPHPPPVLPWPPLPPAPTGTLVKGVGKPQSAWLLPCPDSWRHVGSQGPLSTQAVAAPKELEAPTEVGHREPGRGAALGWARLLLLSSWAGLGTSRQLSGPGGTKSRMPSL